ncbi:MAG: chaperone modulator CbpM [Tatlockia sp.]|jgi:chaperone modulatory protein CbpM
MAEHKKEPARAIGEDWFLLSLSEVTTSFGVSQDTVIEILNEGIVFAQKDEHNELLFDSEAIGRIKTVLRLHRDLGVNLAGAGLAMELLKEIDRLRFLLKNNE